MASPRRQTKKTRKRKRTKAGKKRKSEIKKNGSTKPSALLFQD